MDAVSESVLPIVCMEYLEALKGYIPSAFSSASVSAASSLALPVTIPKLDMPAWSDQGVISTYKGNNQLW